MTIVNRLGMHARPAALVVKTADRYRSQIWIRKDELEVNGKSIMGVLMLAATQGSTVVVRCEGADAEPALKSLGELIATGFGEGS